jgi:hypothetical protein
VIFCSYRYLVLISLECLFCYFAIAHCTQTKLKAAIAIAAAGKIVTVARCATPTAERVIFGHDHHQMLGEDDDTTETMMSSTLTSCTTLRPV